MIYQTTSQDTIDSLLDYLGAFGADDTRRGVPGDVRRDCYRALQSAHREFPTLHRWSYYWTEGRIVTQAPYQTGTIEYTHSTNTLTLTSGTWPSWAASGVVRIGQVNSTVKSRTSNSVLILDSVLNPGADVASGTAYTLYQDSYALPDDFASTDNLFPENHWGRMCYVGPAWWMEKARWVNSSADPTHFTLFGDPERPGNFRVAFYPFPDQSKTIDFVYQRRMRPLQVVSYETGTVTTTSGSAAVTGSGTTWDSRMVGSIFRLSSTTDKPTGFEGSNPSISDRFILSVASTTSLTLDSNLSVTSAGVAYRISDPIDVDPSLLNAFRLCARHHLGGDRIKKDKPQIEADFQLALLRAKEADSRVLQERSAYPQFPWRQRLADMPHTFS